MEQKRQEQINKLRDENDCGKNYLSTYLKHLRKESREMTILKNAVVRAFKTRNKRKMNPNSRVKSGFLKKFTVSDDVITFTGWEKQGKYSRNDVTKFICSYIRTHELQNGTDRRKIIPDKKLTDFIGFDSEIDGQLTYCGIQKCMKRKKMFLTD